MHIIQMDSCLEKQISHVQLTPNFPFPAVSQYVINAGQWMGVSDSICIKYSTIIYPVWQDHTIRFWNEEGREHMSIIQWSYSASIQMLLN